MKNSLIDSKSHLEPYIVFFDGQCGLCLRSVRMLIKFDRQKHLRYAPLQGKTAAIYLSDSERNDLNTLILYQNGVKFLRYQAVIRSLVICGGLSKIAYLGRIVPKFIGNGLYDFIAKYRMKIWGGADSCRLPTQNELELFLD